MANRIVLKRSSVALKVPLAGDLVAGELAVNLTDKVLYTKDASGNVVPLGGSGGGSGTVTGVTATAPVVSSGGAAPVISMAAANTSTPGYLTAADWNTFNGKQAALGFTPYNATNPSGYISGITSANVTTALGYTPYNATNPNGYISNITSANVTTALGYTPYNSSNPSGYITSSGSISGNAATATNSTQLGGFSKDYFVYGDSSNTGSVNTYIPEGGVGANAISRSCFFRDNTSNFTALGIHIQHANNSGYGVQIGSDYGGTVWQVRGKVAGTWGSIATLLTSGNYTSYSPSLTGSGASGTWGINVTGNAATVSNGVYTNSSASISGDNYFTFGPNSSWGKSIRIGGNGRTLTTGSSVVTTNGNLHLDSADGNHIYLNYYAGGIIYLLGGTYTISNGGANYNGNAATTSQRTFGNVKTDGPAWGSYSAASVEGSTGGWGGISFGSTRGNLMVNPNDWGFYGEGSYGWTWRVEAGVLTTGTIPGARVSGNIGGSASNITAYTINQSLGTGNAPTFADVYTNGWFRCTGSQGLYNGTHGNHFYANDNAWWNVAGNNGSIVGIRLRTGGHDGATRGHLYADNGNNIGFLTQDGNWQMRCNNSEVELYDTSYANDFRTYITYDRNDTSYYLDPNGTSELSTLTAATRTRWDMPRRTFNRQAYTGGTGYWTGTRGWGEAINWNQAWGYGFGGFDIWGNNTQHPQGNGYIHAQGICSGLHHVSDDGSNAYGFQLVGGTNASDRLWYRGAWGNSGNNWREIPMFDVNSGNGSWMWFAGWYDNNNSGYYVDPNGTSRMGTINADTLNSYGTIAAYYSDDRLKTRFNNIGGALDMVCSLNGFFYEANETAEKLGYKKKREVGLSAQEVQRILPEIISPAPIDEQYMTIQYDRVVPLLVEAIKELRLELNQLKSLVKL